MADKTTTLKTKTGDNVYPNIIGTNRKDSFADSSTIKHYYYDKTHKVGFQLANATNTKIQNSLQKPVGLTKTELVGVGTNGQENIEIGDNLTLANGKLSASGGDSGVELNILVGTITGNSNGTLQGTYTGTLDIHKINILFIASLSNGYILINVLNDVGDYIQGTASIYSGVNQLEISVANNKFFMSSSPTYNHFITLTSNTAAFYFVYQSSNSDKLDLSHLKEALAGKTLLCNGKTDSEIAEYISGKAGYIEVGVVDTSDYSTLAITIDSSFAISDLVTPVE